MLTLWSPVAIGLLLPPDPRERSFPKQLIRLTSSMCVGLPGGMPNGYKTESLDYVGHGGTAVRAWLDQGTDIRR